MGKKRRALLEQGWPGLFRAQVLPRLPVMELAAAFRKDFGRPCKELHVASGTVILQQMIDFTDEETVRQLAFKEVFFGFWTSNVQPGRVAILEM